MGPGPPMSTGLYSLLSPERWNAERLLFFAADQKTYAKGAGISRIESVMRQTGLVAVYLRNLARTGISGFRHVSSHFLGPASPKAAVAFWTRRNGHSKLNLRESVAPGLSDTGRPCSNQRYAGRSRRALGWIQVLRRRPRIRQVRDRGVSRNPGHPRVTTLPRLHEFDKETSS